MTYKFTDQGITTYSAYYITKYHTIYTVIYTSTNSTMSGGGPLPTVTNEIILSIDDLKAAADRKLGRLAREFYNSGSTDQRTITANSDAFLKYHLRSRVLVDVRGLDTSTTSLGVKVKFPVGCAPAGIARMASEIGEKGTARAARNWGVNMAVSSYASYSVEEIVRAAKDEAGKGGEKWDVKGAMQLGGGYAMQLYPMKDRVMQAKILRRAEEAGCRAVFLTGDSPVLGVRFNEWRNDFRTPEGEFVSFLVLICWVFKFFFEEHRLMSMHLLEYRYWISYV